MTWPPGTLRSPVDGAVLQADTAHSLVANERWPVIDGIPYLRADRRALADLALQALDQGDVETATATLLGDQDDWARTPPASEADRRAVIRSPALSFRDAMDRLAFGGVGTYFAHRWSDPTYLSGLALAEAHWPAPQTVFELACGAGHYLREFARAAPVVAGGDVVFAKLWLARRYVAPAAHLVCFDAAAAWPLPDGWADLVFCHDAFYFMPNKPHVAAEMRRTGRTVLVGHAHNALVDNLSSGSPLTPAAYAALFGSPALYDDRELTAALIEARAPRPATAEALANAPAVSLAPQTAPRPVRGGLAMPPAGAALRRNPLYVDGTVVWPSARYEAEYAALATYPPHTDLPETTTASAKTEHPARTRAYVDLPAQW